MQNYVRGWGMPRLHHSMSRRRDPVADASEISCTERGGILCMRSVYWSCEARPEFRMRIPASAKVFLAAFALAVLQPLSNAPALAQSTCNGMTGGQLTGLNGFVPFPANNL